MAGALLFPGQGSQHVGMGESLARDYAAAADIFAEVDDTLNQHLSRLMWTGPEDELTLTANAQPALMAVSMAAMAALNAEGISLTDVAHYAAGHSLGEYSALAACGSLTLADTAQLLRRRGQAMQRAVPAGEGAMAAIMGPDFDAVTEIAAEAAAAVGGVCQAANDNAPGQVVISGSSDAVAHAIELAKQRGAKRAIKLPVSAPFHCALMGPAATEMAAALAEVVVKVPAIPVICNVSATPISDVDMIRARLVEQVTATVRWRESMRWLFDHGVDQSYEVGAGKVLQGLAKRIERTARTLGISDADQVRACADVLRGEQREAG